MCKIRFGKQFVIVIPRRGAAVSIPLTSKDAFHDGLKDANDSLKKKFWKFRNGNKELLKCLVGLLTSKEKMEAKEEDVIRLLELTYTYLLEHWNSEIEDNFIESLEKAVEEYYIYFSETPLWIQVTDVRFAIPDVLSTLENYINARKHALWKDYEFLLALHMTTRRMKQMVSDQENHQEHYLELLLSLYSEFVRGHPGLSSMVPTLVEKDFEWYWDRFSEQNKMSPTIHGLVEPILSDRFSFKRFNSGYFLAAFILSLIVGGIVSFSHKINAFLPIINDYWALILVIVAIFSFVCILITIKIFPRLFWGTVLGWLTWSSSALGDIVHQDPANNLKSVQQPRLSAINLWHFPFFVFFIALVVIEILVLVYFMQKQRVFYKKYNRILFMLMVALIYGVSTGNLSSVMLSYLYNFNKQAWYFQWLSNLLVLGVPVAMFIAFVVQLVWERHNFAKEI